MCRTRRLWTEDDIEGKGADPEDIDHLEPSTWDDQGSSNEEASFRIDEGTTKRNIAKTNLNILQAADNAPEEVMEIIHEEAPSIEEKFDLDGIETGTKDWYVELCDALAYLSFDGEKDDGYAERYWYHPWRKLKEENPEIEGYFIDHPGKNNLEDDSIKQSEETDSAAEADW